MTDASGLARNFQQMALARLFAGIGEATLTLVVVASSRTPLAKSFRGSINMTRLNDHVKNGVSSLFHAEPPPGAGD